MERPAMEEKVLDPFTFRLRLSMWEQVKIAIGTVTLFPVRLFLAAVLFFLICVISIATTFGLKYKTAVKPISGWRRLVRAPLGLCQRGILFAFGFHWIRWKGKLCTVKEAPIVVFAPHSTFLDFLVMAACFQQPTGVISIGGHKNPLIRSLIHALQPIYVARNEASSRKRAIDEIKRRAFSKEGWPHVIICPEGLCTNGRSIIHFAPGAFYPGLPVQPVVLRYPNTPDTVTWTYFSPKGLQLMWLTMCQLHNNLEIEVLPVYKPNIKEIKDATLYARNVRKKMASCLEKPVTDHAYEDILLMWEAEKHDLPPSAGLVEYRYLSSALGIKLDNMKAHLATFAKLVNSRDGKVHLGQTKKCLLKLRSSESEEILALCEKTCTAGGIRKARALVKTFHCDHNVRETGLDCLDFRQYLIAQALSSDVHLGNSISNNNCHLGSVQNCKWKRPLSLLVHRNEAENGLQLRCLSNDLNCNIE